MTLHFRSRRALVSTVAAVLVAASCSSADPEVAPSTSSTVAEQSSTTTTTPPDSAPQEEADTGNAISEVVAEPEIGTDEPTPIEPTVALTGYVGMSRAVEFLAARTGVLPGPGANVSATVTDGAESCEVGSFVIELIADGSCTVRLDTDLGAAAVTFSVAPQPERSDVDRPGGNVLDLKPVYIRLSDSPDEQRDTNGEIASFVQGLGDFISIHHPGFTLRTDTADGLPDVMHIELPLTTQEFLDQWNDNVGPIGQLLIEHGVGGGLETFYSDRNKGRGLDEFTRIFVGFIEGPRGAYRSPNSNIEGGCGNASGNAIVGYFVRDLNGLECPSYTNTAGMFFRGSNNEWIGYDSIRLLIDPLKANNGCDDEITFVYSNVPLEERDSSITSPRDPIGYPYAVGSEFPKMLDPLRRFYFKAEPEDRFRNPCQDIIYSAFMSDWSHGDQPADDVAGRSTTDRADDVEGDQVRVLYVLPSDAPDQRWDVDGYLHAAVATTNDWLFANGQRTLRFDTFNGDLDVGFVRLPVDEATLWIENGEKCRLDGEPCPNPRDLVDLLDDLGHITPGKIHVIAWGGQLMPASTIGMGCAGAMPDRSAVFMSPSLRWPERSVDTCMMDFPTNVPDSTNTLGLVMFHEVFHVLGAVDLRAPDGDGGYHIGNNASDLMGGSQGTVQLDPNRRNYWAHGRNDLSDVSTSSFMSAEPSLLNSARDDLPQLWRVRIGENFDPFYEPGDSVSRATGTSSPDPTRPPTPYPQDTSVSTPCGDTEGESALRIRGTFDLAGDLKAGQEVALIWVDAGAGRCIAATDSLTDTGTYSLALPVEFHVNAGFEDGGGYCIVVDERGNGVFDSAQGSVECTSNLEAGVDVDWVSRGPGSSSSSPSQSGGTSSAYPSDIRVSTVCNESGGPTAVTFTGRLSGDDVADQPVAVIWITETAGRCIAASTTSSDSGEFTLELPEEAHRYASWNDGGGYCVVWDANGDGIFDSDGEPLDCTSDLADGRTINWTLRS